MKSRAMMLDDYYEPNRWVPFTAALGLHLFLLIWDPTILKASAFTLPAQVIDVKMMDHLPVMEPVKPLPKPAEKPVPKPVEKKPVVKKAKKSGISLSAKPQPLTISHHTVAPKPSAPKPFVSKIAIPKFVPSETEEPIAASPIPGMAPAASRPMTQSIAPPIKLKGRSRGIRAQDVPFQLTDRGSASGLGEHIVSIPIGEERGDIAVLPSAPTIHEAPKGMKSVAGYRYTPGTGSGSGELVGHDKSTRIGYHGVARADSYIEGSLNGAIGNGHGSGKVVAGKGFEIGGPVGDRKITHRKLPDYPAWAEEKGISAMVKVYFTVRPDGTIRSNLRIITSSGYSELDELAKQALMQWRFSPTAGDSSEGAAWGVITFRFTLA